MRLARQLAVNVVAIGVAVKVGHTINSSGLNHTEDVARRLLADTAVNRLTRPFGDFSATALRASAQAGDHNGLTRVGRALQKHSDRKGSVFGGRPSGSVNSRNEQVLKVFDEILSDPGSRAEVLDRVMNIWDSTGRGVRYTKRSRRSNTGNSKPGWGLIRARLSESNRRSVRSSRGRDREISRFRTPTDRPTRWPRLRPIRQVLRDPGSGQLP